MTEADGDAPTVAVTGAGGGLGAQIAERLATDGLRVLVIDVDESAASSVAARIRDGGGTAGPITCDLADPAAVAALPARLEAEAGRLVGLVNCAGGWAGRRVHYPGADPDDWAAVVWLNLTVPMLLIQRLRRVLSTHRGAVVNIGSSAGVETTAYASPEYAVAKAGLIRLTTSLAGLGAEGLRVSCLVPGWIGLPRAHDELAAMTAAERSGLPALVPPEQLAAEVAALVADPDSAGRVVMMLDGTERTILS